MDFRELYTQAFERGASHEVAREFAHRAVAEWLDRQPEAAQLDPESRASLLRRLTEEADKHLPSGTAVGLRGAWKELTQTPDIWTALGGAVGKASETVGELARGWSGAERGGATDILTKLGLGTAAWAGASRLPYPPGPLGTAARILTLGALAAAPGLRRLFRGRPPTTPPAGPTPAAPAPVRPTAPPRPTPPAGPAATPAEAAAVAPPRYRGVFRDLGVSDTIRAQVKRLLQGQRIHPQSAQELEQTLQHLTDAWRAVQERAPKYSKAFTVGLEQALDRTLKGVTTPTEWVGALIHELGPPGDMAVNLIQRGGRLAKTQAQKLAGQLVQQAEQAPVKAPPKLPKQPPTPPTKKPRKTQ